MANTRANSRSPVTVAQLVLGATPTDAPPSAEELSALALAYLDAIREVTPQRGNKVTVQLDSHRYAVAEALAKRQGQTLLQFIAEALDLAIARGSTR